MNNPPRKVTAAKKATARKSVSKTVKLPSPLISKCEFCGAKTNGTQCVSCAFEYSDFLDLLGSPGAPSIYAMFRMYKDLLQRITDLETELEITRIRKKYDWKD